MTPAQQQRMQERGTGNKTRFPWILCFVVGCNSVSSPHGLPFGACTGLHKQQTHRRSFAGVLCCLRCDELMLTSLLLLSGGIKQIILLFSVIFFQETNSKAILVSYHTGQSSILQLWFKSPLQYRMRLVVCMSFLSSADNPSRGRTC